MYEIADNGDVIIGKNSRLSLIVDDDFHLTVRGETVQGGVYTLDCEDQKLEVDEIRVRVNKDNIVTLEDLRYVMAWFDKLTMEEFKQDYNGARLFHMVQGG